MPFVVIKGTFHVVGYSPDGDSVRFRAENDANWAGLSGPPLIPDDHPEGEPFYAQLRFEAVDTLETHYAGEHQPLGLATAAQESLLLGLGITGVEWNESRSEVTRANDGTEGYILSRAVEEYGRPIAFVYTGPPPRGTPDGAEMFLDADLMRRSLNYRLIEEGLAYPTYYEGLFHDLRDALTEEVARARAKTLGVWAEDRTTEGFDVEGLRSVTEEHVVLPKLFRRLVEYLREGAPLSGFKEWLEEREEQVTVVSTAHFTHLDDLVEVGGETGNSVRMTEPPENLVFRG